VRHLRRRSPRRARSTPRRQSWGICARSRRSLPLRPNAQSRQGVINDGPQSAVRSLSATTKDPGLEPPINRLDDHWAPRTGHSTLASPVLSVLVSFTPVRVRSPVTAAACPGWSRTMADGGETLVRSTRKRVKAQVFRGFKSHTSTATDLQERRRWQPTGRILTLP